MLDSALEKLLWPLTAVADLVDQGGPFVICIFLCGFVMWTLVIERAWYFALVLPQQARDALSAWQARSEHRSWCARQIRRAAISRVNTAMNANLVLLRVLVPLSPLLGLVGTVIGMIITFQSITESGSSDPRLMANGIGQAMIATVLGLGIAVPLLFMNAGLASLSRQVVQILDEQSTGLLAERLERHREAAQHA